MDGSKKIGVKRYIHNLSKMAWIKFCIMVFVIVFYFHHES